MYAPTLDQTPAVGLGGSEPFGVFIGKWKEINPTIQGEEIPQDTSFLKNKKIVRNLMSYPNIRAFK